MKLIAKEEFYKNIRILGSNIISRQKSIKTRVLLAK